MAPTPRPTRADLVDLAFAVVVTVAIVGVTVKLDGEDPGTRALDVIGYAACVSGSLVLAVRRRLPRATLAVTTVALAVFILGEYSGGPIYLLPLVGIYSVAAAYERRTAALLAVISTLAVLVPHLLVATSPHHVAWASVLYGGWAAAAVLLGDASRNRKTYLESLEERARHLEETREQEAQKRVAEERLRIARDLHDVVAHSLSSINVQAGAGAHVIDHHPDQAADALLAIKRVSKEALGELRSTLGHLRSADEAAPRRPAPGLDQLEVLVGNADEAGLTVDRVVCGRPYELTPAVDVVAYRIVQESITNVLRHADTDHAEVSISYAPAFVGIEVADAGRGAGRSPGAGAEEGGHGIAGMAERAAGVGGTLRAGPRTEGGFRVQAHLPARPAVSGGVEHP